MRRRWKRLAERASSAAFDDKARSEALASALQGDWGVEVPRGFVTHLRDVLDDPQGDLFGESMIERLEALRGEAAGRPLAGTLLDSAAQAVHQGDRGEEALTKAARNALLERAACGQRQVEEHWLRTPSARDAGWVSGRMDTAIADSDMDAIAIRCIGFDDSEAPRAQLKKTGLDDGVSLS